MKSAGKFLFFFGCFFFGSLSLFAKEPEEPFNLDSFGVGAVPNIVFPGLLDEDLKNVDRLYPFFDRTVENPQLEHNQKNFLSTYQDLQIIAEKPQEDTLLNKVSVVTSELVDQKIYLKKDFKSDIYVYSTRIPIQKVTINGKDTSARPGVFVEVSSYPFTLRPGSNLVEITAYLKNNTTLKKQYNLIFKEKAEPRNWNLLLSLGLGYETNPNGALDKKYASTELIIPYLAKEKPDVFWYGSLNYNYHYKTGTNFTLGAITTNYRKNNENYQSSNTAFAAYTFVYQGFLPYVQGILTSSTLRTSQFYLAGVDYDFFYKEGSNHLLKIADRLLVGGNYGLYRDNQNLSYSTYSLTTKWELNTLRKWVSNFSTEVDAGSQNSDTIAKKYTFLNWRNYAQWDKSWGFYFLGFDLSQQNYPSMNSLSAKNENEKRRDFFVQEQGGLSFVFRPPFSVNFSVLHVDHYSNYIPQKDTLVKMELDYVY